MIGTLATLELLGEAPGVVDPEHIGRGITGYDVQLVPQLPLLNLSLGRLL